MFYRIIKRISLGGRPGFDVGCDAGGACRGRNSPRKKCCKLIVAKTKRNDAVFADADAFAVAA